MRRSLQIVFAIGILICLIYILDLRFGAHIAPVVSITVSISVLSVGVIIFLENRHPTSTVAWMLVLALHPLLGLVCYLLFGRNYRKHRNYDRKAEEDAREYALDDTPLILDDDYTNFSENQRRLMELGVRLAHSPVSLHTKSEILTNGESTFESIIAEVEKATHHIHLEYYIFRDDSIGKKLQELLIRKAKSGVKVRFLYDAVGSLKLPNDFVEEMKEAGIRAIAFSPVVFPILSSKMNYRNHRKMIIVDGQIGFVGGLNVGDEYLGKNERFGFWRDTHVRLEGEAVRTLQIIFLRDWRYMTDEHVSGEEYIRSSFDEVHSDHTGAVQIVASGPDQVWKTASSLFFSLITSAKKSIWIATPYFIPDESIFTALKVAGLSGIDVKILFPKKYDKVIPYYASHSYFSKLLEAGVQIYEYEKGFMHAKTVIVDGEMASIGTVNMDMRSFYLNFEVSAFLYHTESIRTMISDYETDLTDSMLITSTTYTKGLLRRFAESFFRLLSPLL